MRKLRILILGILMFSTSLFAQGKNPPGQQPIVDGNGTVFGEIVDSSNGEPMFGVTAVIRSLNKIGRTDIDGKYSIQKLPAGQYEIEFIMQGMETQKKKVTIADKPIKVNIAMGFKKLTEVVVEGRALNDTESSLLKLQKKSASVSDGISAQAIQKTPDSSAGDVVRRVTGITLVGGKFVFVRGLGERYSNTSFNGVPLSSPEPDKKVIPLDLFPAQLLKNIVVSKTFIPEDTGEFSGGIVKIETKDHPDKFFIKAGLKQGYNNNTTFQDFKTYSGGKNDWLGMDEGNRKKPSTVDLIPGQKFTEAGRFEAGYNRTLISLGSYEFSNQWTPKDINAPMNRGFDFSTGNLFQVMGDKKLGVVFALTYNNDFQFKQEKEIFNLTGPVVRALPAKGINRLPNPAYDYGTKLYEESVNWGSILNTTFDLNSSNRLSWKNFFSVNNDKQVREYSGFNYLIPYEIGAQKLNFIQRNIFNSQLGGDHRVNLSEKASKLDWKISFSEANRNQPDMRDTVYASTPGQLQTGTPATLIESTMSGSHFYSRNKDISKHFGINYEHTFNQPWNGIEGKVKVGYSALNRNRNFEAEFFRMRSRDPDNLNLAGQRTPSPNYPLPPEVIYNPFNRGARGYYVQEDTRATDSYAAQQKLHAKYIQFDMPVLSKLRFIGGARREDNFQFVRTFSPFDNLSELKDKNDIRNYLDRYALSVYDPSYTKTTATNQNKDVLPSLNFVYSLDDKTNIRLAYTETLARPDFREMSPFEFTDIFGGPPVKGNPFLTRSYIHNYDVRYEFYPGEDDLIAFGLFYKQIASPIERVTQVDNQFRYTVVNGRTAYIQGAEVEFRKGLDFISESLKKFSIGVNGFLIKSEVTLNDWAYYELAEMGIVKDTNRPTSLSRPLQGQSPTVLNFNLKYKFDAEGKHTLSLLYNEFGKRIYSVGGLGMPDTYERPVGIVDLVYNVRVKDRWDFKIAGRNLNDARVKIVQEVPAFKTDQTVYSYRLGPTITFSATYSFE